MWGHWSNKDHYNNSTSTHIAVNLRDSKLGSLMARGFMGLGWEITFHHDSSRFRAELGYEIQCWVNQLRIPTFELLRLHGDLILHGGTLNFRLDF
jgi:hypothetical protein